MNDNSYKKKLNPKIKALVILFGLIIIGALLGYGISVFSLEIILTELNQLPIQIPSTRIERSVTYYTGALICLSVILMLLIGLLCVYSDCFRKTKSRFLIGLNAFIIALFIRSVLSIVSLHTIATDLIRVTPYVSRTFLTPGFSELDFLVYGFEIFALSILLYLSME